MSMSYGQLQPQGTPDNYSGGSGSLSRILRGIKDPKSLEKALEQSLAAGELRLILHGQQIEIEELLTLLKLGALDRVKTHIWHGMVRAHLKEAQLAETAGNDPILNDKLHRIALLFELGTQEVAGGFIQKLSR